MYVELPECRRCCFCIPLRHGLLGWAYLKLVLTVLYCALLVYLIPVMFFIPWLGILFAAIMVMCLNDVGFSIVFIIGAHKKNYKMIRIYYYFEIVALGIYTFFFFLYLGIQLYSLARIPREHEAYKHRILQSVVEEVIVYMVETILQGYIIILIRSEFMKLKRNTKFQFLNNAAEAECHLEVACDVTAKGITPLDCEQHQNSK